MPAPLQLVISLGLYRSASTWLFNVMADIARHRGPIQTIFAEDAATLAAQLDDATGFALVKSHAPTPALRLLIRSGSVPVVASIREPLDCVASLMDQFGESFERSAADVVSSSEAILATVCEAGALVLRYEDSDARGSDVVRRIAGWMNVALPDGEADGIIERYEPDSVRALIERLTAEGAFENWPVREQYHPETHWHPRHLGSGKAGRHRQVLSEAQAAVLAYRTRAFRQHFGYADPSRQRFEPGSVLDFAGAGLSTCEAGFDRPEGWGIWTSGFEACVILPLASPAATVSLMLLCRLAPVLSRSSDALVQVYLNGSRACQIAATDEMPETLLLAMTFDAKGSDVVQLVFKFENLVPVDPRLLGLGLSRLELHYEAATEATFV